jgi:AcrR family transcriptional regulator
MTSALARRPWITSVLPNPHRLCLTPPCQNDAVGVTPGRVGRPRATGESAGERDSRQDLLDAAAELFTERGYTATSTRAVAELAGLRQASLYHYFGGKEDVLAELLEGTVRPSLRTAEVLRDVPASAAAKLWALCRFDIDLLCRGRHNLGALYLLSEVSAARFAGFRRDRAALKAAYRALLGELAGPVSGLDTRADLLFGLVEGVILTRREKAIEDVAAFASAGADAGVRLAGCAESDLPEIRLEGLSVLATGKTESTPNGSPTAHH